MEQNLICPDCHGTTTPDELDRKHLTHICEHCGYIIMHSEWVPLSNDEQPEKK